MRKPLITLAVMLVLGTLIMTPAIAQVLYGSIVGTVEDPTGSVVPKAKITLTSKATGTVRDTIADEAGRYSLLSLLPGAYDVKVTATGFRTLTQTDVEVTINTVTRVDLKLEVGQISEQVTVSATAAALQTDKSDVRTEIASSTLNQMPLPGYRNYQSLINLVPGATPAAYQNAVVDSPGRALTTNVNGTNRNSNNTLVDGAVNINVWLPHHTAYVQPMESIDTVNVSTNSFDAEQGMAGGAAITVTTKSGTNDLHGVAFWFHNNQHLNTAPYYRSVNYKMPLSILNIAGGTLGGAIKKDKLFYFFSYEGTRERTGSTNYYSVAPADFRTGNFSRTSAWTTIYDPASGATAADRTAFPNNTIPTSRLSSIFSNIYSGMPLPNVTSTSDTTGYNLSGNYEKSGVLKLDRNQYDLKMNYNLSQKTTLWGKYSRMHAPVEGVYPFGKLGGSAIGTEGIGDTTTQLMTVGFSHTFSPTFLWDGVFGYTRMDQNVDIPGQDTNMGLDTWKIPGTNGGTQYANDKRYGGAPNLSGFGFSDIGVTATWAPVERHERAYTFQTNMTKVWGAHEVRWGFEPRRLEMNHWQPETANPRGYIEFWGGVTATQGQTTRSPNQFATAMLGLTSYYSKSIQYMLMQTREWQLGWYVRDRWQVNRKLTINLGLRYEYYPLINRGDRGIERWDPNTNIVYFGGLGNTPRSNGIEVSKKLFAPRVGFAYRLTNDTVIRAGYGITYDPVPFSRPLRGLYPSTLTGTWTAPTSTYGWYNDLATGIPAITTPDTSKGYATLPTNMDMGPRSPWGGMLHRGYTQSWNLTAERRLPWDTIASLGYVATRTVHQLIDRNINTVGPGLGTTTANLPLAKAYGRTIASNMWDGIGWGTYDSLQAAATKNMTHGLMVKAAYTWSKSQSMVDDDGWASLPYWNWEPMIARNFSRTGYDRAHMFTVGWVYEMPFGKGKLFNMGGVADKIFGGWSMNGTFGAWSGTPFSVTGSGSSLMCTGCQQTADQLGPVKKLDGKGPGQPFYDPASFRDPLWSFKTTGVYRAGSTGRNILRRPGYWQLSPGLFKNFTIKEKYKAEFRAESTNIAHNANWSAPSGSSANATVDSTGAITNLNNFLCITSADSTRQFRFGLRVSF
jgi:outer membrane receptor protein involved in Fe transport